MWFYLVEGARQGPVVFEHLVSAILAAPDPAAVLVWREGLANWLPAGAVPELAAKLPPAIPPATPPPVPMPQAARPILTFGAPAVAEDADPVLIEGVARHYRRLVLLVGGQILLGFALQAPAVAGTSDVVVLFAWGVLLLALATTIIMIVTVHRLMSLLDDGVPALWAVAMLVPIINILILLVISSKAQKWCKRHGIPVGFFGPTTTGR
jgi:hypothetical protein